MKTLAILFGEHPCIVNILFGPVTAHYREVLLFIHIKIIYTIPNKIVDAKFNMECQMKWAMPN